MINKRINNNISNQNLKSFLNPQKLKIIKIVFLAVMVILAGYFTFSYFKIKKQINDQNKEILAKEVKDEKMVEDIIERVNKLISLPTDKKPLIATIVDVDSLIEKQPFFIGAKNGNKLLLYENRAIIYDYENNKLVNVGPIYQTTESELKKEQKKENNNSALQMENEISLEIRNGTDTVGKASNLAEEYKDVDGLKIIKIANAEKKDYEQTLVVNLNNVNLSAITPKLSNYKVINNLPDGEKNTEADVLIIVGE